MRSTHQNNRFSLLEEANMMIFKRASLKVLKTSRNMCTYSIRVFLSLYLYSPFVAVLVFCPLNRTNRLCYKPQLQI